MCFKAESSRVSAGVFFPHPELGCADVGAGALTQLPQVVQPSLIPCNTYCPPALRVVILRVQERLDVSKLGKPSVLMIFE